MHETGVIRQLIHTATREAEARGARLVGIQVRLGALAGGTADHMREHFEIECRALGLGELAIDIEEDPDYPAGVELSSIELAGEGRPGVAETR